VILSSLLFCRSRTASPADDRSKVGSSCQFDGIPHMLVPVVTDMNGSDCLALRQ
jgi:hypothetical protein